MVNKNDIVLLQMSKYFIIGISVLANCESQYGFLFVVDQLVSTSELPKLSINFCLGKTKYCGNCDLQKSLCHRNVWENGSNSFEKT